MGELTKKCTKCGEVKLLSEFSKQSSRKDGLKSNCKECNSKYSANYNSKLENIDKSKQWYQDNKDKSEFKLQKSGSNKQWRNDNLEKVKEYGKQYYQDNKGELISNQIQWRKNNKDKVNELGNQWRQDNPNYSKQWVLDHQDEFTGTSLHYPYRLRHPNQELFRDSQEIREQILDIQIECARLNREAGYTKWHVDHEYPLFGKLVSGLHVPNNLRIILATENLTKSNIFDPDTYVF